MCNILSVSDVVCFLYPYPSISIPTTYLHLCQCQPIPPSLPRSLSLSFSLSLSLSLSVCLSVCVCLSLPLSRSVTYVMYQPHISVHYLFRKAYRAHQILCIPSDDFCCKFSAWPWHTKLLSATELSLQDIDSRLISRLIGPKGTRLSATGVATIIERN